MLLEFKTKNYKSFVEEASFSMVAAPKQKGLDYSLMKTKIKGKEIKGLFDKNIIVVDLQEAYPKKEIPERLGIYV